VDLATHALQLHSETPWQEVYIRKKKRKTIDIHVDTKSDFSRVYFDSMIDHPHILARNSK
jgi:hypothetical protein